MIYIVIALAALNAILVYACYNLNRQIEDIEDYNKGLEEYIFFLRDRITSAYNTIKKADTRGSFEADDEVGTVFTDIKQAVEYLETLFTDTDDNAKKT